jgi:O-antigen/teichoic acid export membrane protein
MFARLMTLIFNFLSFPIVLNNTGITKFGIFLLLSNLVILTSFSDLGIGNGAINKLVEKNKDPDQVNLIADLSKATLISGGIIALISIAFSFGLPTDKILQIPTDQVRDFKFALLTAVVCYSFGPISTFPNKIYLARSQNRKSAYYTFISSLVANSFLILFAILHFPLWALVAAQTMLPILLGLYIVWFRIIRIEKTNKVKIKFNVNSIFDNLKNGRIYLILQISAVASYQIDSMIVSHFLGPDQVTVLMTTWKVCSLPVLLVSFGFMPLWQSSRELDLKNNRKSVFLELSNSLKRITIFLAIFILLFNIFGTNLILLWSSDIVNVDRSVLICSSIWLFFYAISQPIAYVLNGLQENKFNVISSLLSTIFNVFFSIVLTSRLNSPIGPLLGSCIAQVLFFLIPFYLFQKRMKSRLRRSSTKNRIKSQL